MWWSGNSNIYRFCLPTECLIWPNLCQYLTCSATIQCFGPMIYTATQSTFNSNIYTRLFFYLWDPAFPVKLLPYAVHGLVYIVSTFSATYILSTPRCVECNNKQYTACSAIHHGWPSIHPIRITHNLAAHHRAAHNQAAWWCAGSVVCVTRIGKPLHNLTSQTAM